MSYFGPFALKAKATLISDDPFFGPGTSLVLQSEDFHTSFENAYRFSNFYSSTLWSVLFCCAHLCLAGFHFTGTRGLTRAFFGWPRSAYLYTSFYFTCDNMLPCGANRGIKWISCAPRFASVWRFAQVEPGTSRESRTHQLSSEHPRFLGRFYPLLIVEQFRVGLYIVGCIHGGCVSSIIWLISIVGLSWYQSPESLLGKAFVSKQPLFNLLKIRSLPILIAFNQHITWFLEMNNQNLYVLSLPPRPPPSRQRLRRHPRRRHPCHRRRPHLRTWASIAGKPLALHTEDYLKIFISFPYDSLGWTPPCEASAGRSRPPGRTQRPRRRPRRRPGRRPGQRPWRREKCARWKHLGGSIQ